MYKVVCRLHAGLSSETYIRGAFPLIIGLASPQEEGTDFGLHVENLSVDRMDAASSLSGYDVAVKSWMYSVCQHIGINTGVCPSQSSVYANLYIAHETYCVS